MVDERWACTKASAACLMAAVLASTPSEGRSEAVALASNVGVVAHVNGVVITDAALNAALAVSGKPDTAALRSDLKQRLIARELLRQAAAAEVRLCRSATYDGPASNESAELSPCVEHAIGEYLRSVLHPGAVTDADVRERYAQFVSERGLPAEAESSLTALRERIQTERFEHALQQFVDRLLNEADVLQ